MEVLKRLSFHDELHFNGKGINKRYWNYRERTANIT